MFSPVSSKVSFPELEDRNLKLWKEREVFRRTWDDAADKPLFMLYEGPPTANGTPGIHHVLARVFKDVIPRYKTMQGFRAFRKGGWDTHGLPVEIEVEKQLGITTKQEIEEYGIDKFNALCRESVMRYVKAWEELTERIGFWIDMDNAYITFDNGYIQSGWWIIKELWDRNLVYQGYKVTPHCPRCVTSLSSHEVSLGYKDDTPDPSVFVRFPMSNEQDEALDAAKSMGWSDSGWDGPTPSVLAWTTTPWTLTANLALAVAPKEEYALVASPDGSERLLLAAPRVDEVLGEGWTVQNTFKGSELQGLRYEPPFVNATEHDGQPFHHRVLPADYVGMDDGTGVVHTAPAYGAEDNELGRTFNLPAVHTVDLQGHITGDYPGTGKFVKEADVDISADLTKRGLMFRQETILHTYPFCWRCGTPLLYYAKPSWYIRTTEYKDEMVALNGDINWHPEHIQQGRFGEWLRNNVDWAISRERYWGTPLPIWRCDTCGEDECFGNLDTLRERADAATTGALDLDGRDLHRPYIDEVTVTCKCGGTMHRVPEVLDCWFDSGAMPYAQFNATSSDDPMFTGGQFPADYICEAVDQTRGWFYSLHALAVLLRKEPSYKNVICLGLILDDQGEKMSKTKGNIVEPWSVINAHGADALRWYLLTAAPPGNARRFSQDLVEESVRKFLLTLWNTYSFFVTYALLDGFEPTSADPGEPVAELDRWVISELNQLVMDVTAEMEDYNPTDAGRKIEAFVGELSTWYVRRSRRRFWKSENDGDKRSAYQTLYTCLVTLSKLMAPLTPFIAEEMYQNLVVASDPTAPDSVHLADFPKADTARIDKELGEATQLVMKVVSMGRAARQKVQAKVRQPLAEVLVMPKAAAEGALLLPLADQVRDELNVKTVQVIGDAEAAKNLVVRLNGSVVGPKYTDRLPALQKAFGTADKEAVIKAALTGQPVTVGEFTLDAEDLDISPSPDSPFAGVLDGGYYVAIDTRMTPELKQEGLARELVHNIQNMRRTADFDISDRIVVWYQCDAALQDVLTSESMGDYIRTETLAVRVEQGTPDADAHVETLKIEGMELTIGVKRAQGQG